MEQNLNGLLYMTLSTFLNFGFEVKMLDMMFRNYPYCLMKLSTMLNMMFINYP